MIGGYNISRPRSIMEEIKSHFEGNDDLIKTFGHFKHKDCLWTKDEFQLYDPIRRRRVPFKNMYSCTGVGMGTAVAGKHPDLVVLDDLVNEQNIGTRDMLESPKLWLKYVRSTYQPWTEELSVGTRYSPDDAYGSMIKDPFSDVFLRSARGQDGKLFFPGEQDDDFLRRREIELGSYVFACQYLNSPITDKNAMFKSDWINDALVDPYSLDPKDCQVIMAVDPAISVSKRADYTGICVVVQDKSRKIWVVEAVKRKMENAQLVAELKRIYTKWNPDYMLMEEVSAFKLMRPLIERYDPKFGETIRYKPHRLDNQRSKEHRIRATTPLVEFGSVKVFKNNVDFISELRRYTGAQADPDNILDAFEMCVSRLRPPDPQLEKPDPSAIIRELRKKEDLDDRAHLMPDQDNENLMREILLNVYA
jgi:predicted phage terminase large subunit-like protein